MFREQNDLSYSRNLSCNSTIYLEEAILTPKCAQYSMGVIVLWLREVYAEDGEYTNERVYNELFGDNIRKAINSSNSLEDTIALTIGQIMAAYYPPQRPTIEQCWESDFFGYWEPPPVKEGLDHTTAFESKEVGPNVDTEVSPDDSGAVESIHKAKNHPTSGQVKMRTTSVLAQTSKGPASFGVQQPARVQKNRSKVPISNKLLDALSRTSLTEDT